MRLLAPLLIISACGRADFGLRATGIGNVNGVVLSEPGALVVEDRHYDVASSVDGAGYAVAWQEFPPDSQSGVLEFAVVSERLEVVVPATPVDLGIDIDGVVRIVTGTDGYLLLVGHTGKPTEVFALDAAGTPIHTATDATVSLHNATTFAATPDGFVEIGMANSGIFARTLDHQGNATSALVLIDAGGGGAEAPVLAHSGAGFIAMWDQGGRLRMRRLDDHAQAIDPTVTTVYDVGQTQGHPFLAGDGAGGYIAAWDGGTSFPFQAMHFAADNSPLWPAPVKIYDQPRYHDTADGAGLDDGKLGFAWVTGVTEEVLTNIEMTVIDASTTAPTARLLSDPQFSFCYPEVARTANSVGTVFVGDVPGAQAIFLAIQSI
jgi:hypothetical protein